MITLYILCMITLRCSLYDSSHHHDFGEKIGILSGEVKAKIGYFTQLHNDEGKSRTSRNCDFGIDVLANEIAIAVKFNSL